MTTIGLQPVTNPYRPRENPRTNTFQTAEAEAGVQALIASVGEDPNREGLVDTPARVVRAMREMTGGYDVDVAALLARDFEVGPTDEMVVVTGIRVVSMCEHHLMPFTGTATVAYLPTGTRVVGLSKIPRVVEAYAMRFQVQERLTRQIVTALDENLDTGGSACLIRATHACMSVRGARQHNGEMVTSVLTGSFRVKAETRAEFMAIANR